MGSGISIGLSGMLAAKYAMHTVGTNIATAANCTRALQNTQSMYEIGSMQEQSVSGVSLDEEAARLLEYQQLFSSCAKYVATVSELTERLLEYL